MCVCVRQKDRRRETSKLVIVLLTRSSSRFSNATSNAEESVIQLWLLLEKSNSRSRLYLTHIDIRDDQHGIPGDVGGCFGQAEAQWRVVSP